MIKDCKPKFLTRVFKKFLEQELWARVVNKSCEQKLRKVKLSCERLVVNRISEQELSCKHELWTWILKKSFEQKLWIKLWGKFVKKICAQRFKQSLWKKVVNTSCQQKLWTKDMNKSC